MTQLSPWVMLRRLLEPDIPARADLYVDPGYGSASYVVDEVQSDPASTAKFLLVGARGGGKSSELRRIARDLAQTHRVVEIDLDASQVNAASVNADDLAYLCGVGALRFLGDAPRANELFYALKAAYADDDAASGQLGDLKTALDGLVTFSTAAGAAAVALGGTSGVAPVLAATFAAAKLILLSGLRRGVIQETSPHGRKLANAVANIVRVVREADPRPLCMLVDGLEKMNGESGERLAEVFQSTRLLSVLPIASVYAAPPSTLTATHSLETQGWKTQPVWGFGEAGMLTLENALTQRFKAVDLDPTQCVEPGLLRRIAESSGGMPRDAVAICGYAVSAVRRSGEHEMSAAHVEEAIEKRGRELGMGLDEDRILALMGVREGANLPRGTYAASLFAAGKILAIPPRIGNKDVIQRFRVHPLLEESIRLEETRRRTVREE